MAASRRKRPRSREAPAAPRLSDVAWGVRGRIREHSESIGAVVLTAASLLTLLAMVGLTSGALVDGWVLLLRRWLGWFALVVPLTIGAGAATLALRRLGRTLDVPWIRIIGLELGLFALMGATAALGRLSLAESEAGSAGGLIGWGLSSL